jgi:multidrug efflux pump subunit AcrB
LAYAVASDRLDEEGLSWFVEDTIAKRLLLVRGVGAVSRVGGVTREVAIALDPARGRRFTATTPRAWADDCLSASAAP